MMNPRILFGIGLAYFIVAAEVSGRCVKGGYDTCGCSDGSIKAVDPVRPPCGEEKSKVVCKKIIYKPIDDFGTPVGDTCGCSSFNVHPANLPKPKCIWGEMNNPSTVVNDNGETLVFDSAEGVYETVVPKYIRAPKYMHDFGDSDSDDTTNSGTGTDNTEVLVPVDTVSMNIVQEMQRKTAISKTDEQLFYGFQSLPAERPVIKSKEDVPEENLYTFDRRIVELKPQKTVVKCGDGPDSEVVVQDGKQPVAFLSYGDLGFAPIQGTSSQFVKKTCTYKGADVADDSAEYVRKYYKKNISESDEIIKTPGSDEVVDEDEYEYVSKTKKSCGCA